MDARCTGRAGVLGLCAVIAASLPAKANQTLTIAGSTTLLPLVRQAAQSYENRHADMLLVVTGGGSRAAIAQLVGKQIDIAATDTPSGSNTDLLDHRIAVIAFAFAVNPETGITSLTRKQLADVFSGAVKNWKDVGGKDLPVALVNRPTISGVRMLIADRIMGGAPIVESGAVDESTASTIADIKANPGAIGYASFGGLSGSGLTLVSIDDVVPIDENVENGTYPLWAYEHMITFGPPNPDVSRFLAFLETNRALLHQFGYIPVHDMKVSSPNS
jgi:phosphate transport system substrate-binding protein